MAALSDLEYAENLNNAMVQVRNDSLLWSPAGLGGKGDLQATTYLNGENPLFQPYSLLTLYMQSGLLARVASLPPSAAIMQGGFYVKDPSSKCDPMVEEDQRLNVKNNAYMAALFAGIFGMGYLYIVADEIDGNQDMTKPLRPENIRRIENLLPMTTIECTPGPPTAYAPSRNFGRGDLWSCVPYPLMSGREIMTHHSRILFFPGVPLPNRDMARNRGAAMSVYQGLYEQFKGWQTLDQSVGNIVQRMHTLVYEANNLGASLAGDQGEQFRAKMVLRAQMRSTFNLEVVDQGESMTIAAAPPTGFGDLSAHEMTAFAAAANIPRPILFEPEGGFSQGDAQEGLWGATVKAYSARVLRPPLHYLYSLVYAQQSGPFAKKLRRSSVSLAGLINRPVMTRNTIANLLNHPAPLTSDCIAQALQIATQPAVPIPPASLTPAYSVEFRPLHTEDLQEQAERRGKQVDYLIKLKDAGAITGEEIRANLFGPDGWQDEIQPLPPLNSDAAILSLDPTLQAILKDVAAGGSVEEAQELLNEEFPYLAGQTPGMIAAAVRLRKPPEAAAVEVPATVVAAEAPTDAAATATDTTPSPLDPLLRREVAAGGTRSGTGPEGPWSVRMPCDYGEIQGTRGLDAEPVDYLLIPEGPRGTAYIAEILLPGDEGEDPTLDEHKVILGCADEEAAMNLLSEVYGESVEIGDVTTLPEARLLAWLETAGTARASSLDGTPPEAVRIAAKQGLAWQKEHGGSKATPAAIAWARRLAAGMPISRDRLRSVAAAHRLHAAPAPLPDGDAPTPAHIRHALTGGDAGREWVAALTAAVRTDAPGKYEHINFKPPAGARDEAQKGLDWRREHGRGGTPVGISRARDLARGANMSPETIGRMHSFFARHEGDKKGKGFTPGDGFPSNGRIAWALWGGDAGKAWTDKVWGQMEAADRA